MVHACFFCTLKLGIARQKVGLRASLRSNHIETVFSVSFVIVCMYVISMGERAFYLCILSVIFDT